MDRNLYLRGSGLPIKPSPNDLRAGGPPLFHQKTIEWDRFYLGVAFMWSSKSKDTSTKAGCVFVSQDWTQLAAGYNGLPRGIEPREDRLNDRPLKYLWHEHAERNAIDNAAREGAHLKGSQVYLTGNPCASCARGLVNVGTVRLVIPQIGPFTGRDDWLENMTTGAQILYEGGVQVYRMALEWIGEHGDNNPLVKDGSGPNV